jgi:flagellar basal-body rod protein FlgB
MFKEQKRMFENLTLFKMAQRSLDYQAKRQSVLADNVANANTPHFKSKDLSELSFKDLLKPDSSSLQVTQTHPNHMSLDSQSLKVSTLIEKRPDETKPDGNEVSLEEQMAKIGDVQGKYTLAINLFMKHVSMLKTAIGK